MTRAFKKHLAEDWQFNGMGQPVYIGDTAVSQYTPTGTSPGIPYVPDEVAKMIIKETGLRKNDTCSKRMIVGYLESMGLSAGLAVDVAMVLRDVYGVTPTFEESVIGRCGGLIEELATALNDNFPMPFVDTENVEPKLLSEVEFVGSLLAQEIMESDDELHDTVLAQLALVNPTDLLAIAEFQNYCGEEIFIQFMEMGMSGYDVLAEGMLDGLCWPERISYLSDDVQQLFSDLVLSEDTPFGQRVATAKKAERNPIDALRMPRMAKAKGTPRASAPVARPSSSMAPKAPQSEPKAEPAKAVPTAPQGHAKMSPGPATKAFDKQAARDHQLSLPVSQRKIGKIKAKGDSEIQKSDPMAHPITHPDRLSALKAKFAAHAAKHEPATPEKHEPKAEPAKPALASGPNLSAFDKKHNSPSRLKAAGSKALGVAKKIGGAVAKGAKFVAPHLARAAKAVGRTVKGAAKGSAPHLLPAAKAVGKAGFGLAKHVVGGAAELGTHVAGSALRGVASGLFGAKTKSKAASKSKASKAKASEKESETDGEHGNHPFVHAAKHISNFLGHLWHGAKAGYRNSMPASAAATGAAKSSHEPESKGSEKSSAAEPATEKPKSNRHKKAGKAPEAQTASLVRNNEPLLGELDAMLSMEDYPELGKTPYGPAGNPKEGPQLTKDYMSVYPVGHTTPDGTGMTPELFQDPVERKRKRKQDLEMIMQVINSMRGAAEVAGVPPEGMFLNVFRDLHREKARYS